MKLIPCSSLGCSALGAMLQKSVAYPDGEPYLAAMYDPSYKCNRCGRPQGLSSEEFSRLPDLTVDQLFALAEAYRSPALRKRFTADLVGAGLKEEHAVDMLRAGFIGSDEVHALSRQALKEDHGGQS